MVLHDLSEADLVSTEWPSSADMDPDPSAAFGRQPAIFDATPRDVILSWLDGKYDQGPSSLSSTTRWAGP